MLHYSCGPIKRKALAFVAAGFSGALHYFLSQNPQSYSYMLMRLVAQAFWPGLLSISFLFKGILQQPPVAICNR